MQRILAGLLVVCAYSYADTLRLKSGRTVEGTYLGGDSRNIRFDNGERVQTFSINDVSEVSFGAAEATSVSSQQPARPVLTPAHDAARSTTSPSTASQAESSRPSAAPVAAKPSSGGS